jgi:hypothetical protein
LPRAFAASENQLFDYARRVCDATDLPVIVQDWNPGGNPLFPALRSDPMALSAASRNKQIPSSNMQR